MTTPAGNPMTTEQVMKIALNLSGLKEVPPDSGVHLPGDKVHRILATIDCGVDDLLLARVLRCDAVLTHHPEWTASLHGWTLIARQIDQMVECGVPVAKAEPPIQRRMQSVELNSHPRNYGRVLQAAKLLNLAFLNVHLPCDIISRRIISEKMARFQHPESRATVADVIAALQEIPEQKLAATLVITGHMASDSIGINVYLDELDRRGLEVIRAGGIIPGR